MAPNFKRIVIIPLFLFSFLVFGQAGNTDHSFNSNLTNRFGGGQGTYGGGDNKMLLLPNGKIILAGDFSKYNGKACDKIIRLNSDGSIDDSFNAGTTVTNTQSILSLALQPDGKILVGGNFTSFGGQPHIGLVRLNSDGSLDNSFNLPVQGYFHVRCIRLDAANNIFIATYGDYQGPGIGPVCKLTSTGAFDMSFSNTYLPYHNSLTNWVNVIELLPGGKMLVGGTYGMVARLNANGSLDNSFTAPDLWYEVLSLVPMANGKVVVGGVTLLRRLNADGTVDNSFAQPNIQFWDADIRCMTLLGNGQILASGSTLLGNGIFKINPDGTRDLSVQFEGGETIGPVYSQFIQPDGKILVSGGFSTNKFRTTDGIERFNPDGTIDVSFNRNNGIEEDGIVKDLAIFPDGKILLVGKFSSYNQVPRNSVVRLNNDGTLDMNFTVSLSPDANVITCAIQPDGKFFVSGILGMANGVSYQYLARFNSDGSFDPSFFMSSGIHDIIHEIVIQNDGKIMLGGFFTSYDNQPVERIIRLNPNGSRDNTFLAGMDYVVNSILVQPDGKYLVGGDFNEVNGSSTYRGGIVRLNANGSIDESFQAYGIAPNSGYVKKIAFQTDGKILVGGTFTNFNNTNVSYLVRLNADGTRDLTFVPNYTMGPVYDLIVEPDGKVLIAGYVSSGSNGGPVARLLPDGSGDNTFMNFRAYDLGVSGFAMQPNGRLIVAGEFTYFGDDHYHGVIRLLNDTNGPQPFNLSFTDVLNISCSTMGQAVPKGNFGYPPYTYQWTNPQGFTDTAFFSVEGVYTCMVTDNYQNTATASLLVSGPTTQTGTDLSTEILAQEFRPGFAAQVDPVVLNTGCLSVDGVLELTYDPLLQFGSAVPAPDVINGNVLRWNVDQLLWDSAGFSPDVNFTTSVNAAIGDTIVLTTFFFPGNSSLLPVQQTDYFPVVNGFDPNDKKVNPGKCQEGFISKDQELTYTIRFQNTGNSDAINIRVEDLLHENLDISSLRMIGASHSYWVEVKEQKDLIFHFDQIHLPAASINEAGSHGYIRYKITPKPGLNENDQITGSASIYFDFNDPIVTNNALSTIFEGDLNKISCYPGDDLNEEPFVCFPNPATDFLNIYAAEPIKGIYIYNVAGNLIYKFEEMTLSLHVDMAKFDKGVYLIRMETIKGRSSLKKIIVTN